MLVYYTKYALAKQSRDALLAGLRDRFGDRDDRETAEDYVHTVEGGRSGRVAKTSLLVTIVEAHLNECCGTGPAIGNGYNGRPFSPLLELFGVASASAKSALFVDELRAVLLSDRLGVFSVVLVCVWIFLGDRRDDMERYIRVDSLWEIVPMTCRLGWLRVHGGGGKRRRSTVRLVLTASLGAGREIIRPVNCSLYPAMC